MRALWSEAALKLHSGFPLNRREALLHLPALSGRGLELLSRAAHALPLHAATLLLRREAPGLEVLRTKALKPRSLRHLLALHERRAWTHVRGRLPLPRPALLPHHRMALHRAERPAPCSLRARPTPLPRAHAHLHARALLRHQAPTELHLALDASLNLCARRGLALPANLDFDAPLHLGARLRPVARALVWPKPRPLLRPLPWPGLARTLKAAHDALLILARPRPFAISPWSLDRTGLFIHARSRRLAHGPATRLRHDRSGKQQCRGTNYKFLSVH